MSTLQKSTAERVVEALNARGYRASFEYPGFVHIAMPDGTIYATGDANETWDVQHRTQDGADGLPGSFDTEVPVMPANTEISEDYQHRHVSNITNKIVEGLRHWMPVLSVGYLRDVMTRAVSVMEEQKDENGESFSEPNAILHAELQGIERLATDAIMTSHMGTAETEIVLQASDWIPRDTENVGDALRMMAQEQLVGLLHDVTKIAVSFMEDSGGCDHSVGICDCVNINTLENAVESLRLHGRPIEARLHRSTDATPRGDLYRLSCFFRDLPVGSDASMLDSFGAKVRKLNVHDVHELRESARNLLSAVQRIYDEPEAITEPDPEREGQNRYIADLDASER